MARRRSARLIATIFAVAVASGALAAEDGGWSVSKSSGEVWIDDTGAQQASLQPRKRSQARRHHPHRPQRPRASDARRGDDPDRAEFRGRAARRKEGRAVDDHRCSRPARSCSMSKSATSSISRSKPPTSPPWSRERSFASSVNATSTSVEVKQGTGRSLRLQVGPDRPSAAGPGATAFAHGKTGLSLSGSGTFNPIEQGKPRARHRSRAVPAMGSSAAQCCERQVIHALGTVDATTGQAIAPRSSDSRQCAG